MKIIPKKSLGQHFLRSEGALQKIIDSVDLKKTDLVLEVGPGEGVMTSKLLEKAKKVVAIEKDWRSVEVLNEKFKKEITKNKLILIEKDILEIDLQKDLPKDYEDYKVGANIPYYISGALLRFFLESKNQPRAMTLLLQKEVVERILSKDGKESILSISVKVYGDVSSKGIVKAGSFFPPPKVDSAILQIENISKKFFQSNDIREEKFFEILRAGFAHKRKMVGSNLKLKGFALSPGLDPKSRAEDLRLADWAKIAKFN